MQRIVELWAREGDTSNAFYCLCHEPAENLILCQEGCHVNHGKNRYFFPIEIIHQILVTIDNNNFKTIWSEE